LLASLGSQYAAHALISLRRFSSALRLGNPVFDQGSVSAVIAGDDERGAAALPLLSQHGFGDRVRSSDSNGTGA
jgi:hypothetical protein